MTSLPGRFLEVHVIQPVPYANLNRDDTNSVKTVEWGGVERTRVSSQSWKRAIRLHLQQAIGQEALRTRRLPELIAAALTDEHDWPADLAEKAGRYVSMSSSVGAEPPNKKKDDDESDGEKAWTTAAMIYVPAAAVAELARLAIRYRDALEQAKQPTKFERKHAAAVIPTAEVDAVLRSRNGIINLFGRMLAQVDDAHVDGAVQVAHSFTTHATDTEIDYFSAVDDITADWRDTTGSAHMGNSEHSAGVLYRYVVLDLEDLHRNLGGALDDTARLSAELVRATLLSLPQAKKNSTAPNTIPHLAHVTIRSGRPVSYAAAFEKPVRPERFGGHAAPSVAELDRYAGAVQKLLGKSGLLYSAYATLADDESTNLGERVDSFDDLIKGALARALPDGARA
ncbi:type I-E CRISPR-associated protein Cas7/Cse4/CasC [Actinomadura parmotrematis]|uniref:Type I-E CRISPR-associated protein Cas7/Cse4/CasC n=1 Tax=Actinomadura parmotrematis TaxID=2864039 RepID=A0ABS7FVY3_9ACTN|nr:type I-E CRISPR-associated protein Cas7/Cse4/CasC [Actinomadura parmotrematis]MBW8484436.1 type I-E CRISPR-associated protein Cas7/Cse4/CasC [Actinomadura parmotrematis]